MDIAKGTAEEFVTVVSVGSQSPPENFVTVLSIGNAGKRSDEKTSAAGKGPANGTDGMHLEEEVEVFRLPGERLGFGLKFEGGNKTSERVRRLFVQSCAEQSPASRAKCSWGTLGEGDEVKIISLPKSLACAFDFLFILSRKILARIRTRERNFLS